MSDNVDVPAKYRARSVLRESMELVQRLFECFDAAISRHKGSEAFLQPEQIMKTLVEKLDTLSKIVNELIEHQELHNAIEGLRVAVRREDSKIAKLTTSLRNAEAVLQEAMDEAAPRLKALERATKHPVDADEVISYGSKISASMSAPPGWDGSQPLGNHLPPAPPEDVMRSGKLAALEVLSEGIDEKNGDGSGMQ